MSDEVLGGVKVRAPRAQAVSRIFDFGKKKKPQKQKISLTSMQNALSALMNDAKNSSDNSQDTPNKPRSDNSSQSSEDRMRKLNAVLIKKLRKKEAVVIRRQPSQRAAAAAAKKAFEKIEELKPQSSKRTEKPRATPLNKKVKMEIINEEPTSRSVRVPKHPTRFPFDDDRIVKRNLSDVIAYPHKEDYVNKFTELFDKPLKDLEEKVNEHAMNKQEPLQGNEAKELILQLTDDLYFTIRDKLIRKLELRSRSL